MYTRPARTHTRRFIGIAAAASALLLAAIAMGADRAPAAATAVDAQADARDGGRGHHRSGPREIDLAKLEKRSREAFDRIDSNDDERILPAELAAAGPMGFMARGFGRHGRGHFDRHLHRHGDRDGDSDSADHRGRQHDRHAGAGPDVLPMPSGAPPPAMGADDDHPAPPDPQQMLAAVFKRLDANNDGRLSDAEFKNLHDAQRAEMQAQAFARLDTDSNGSLSRGEFPPMLARLQGLDANHDGKLTRDELPRHRSRPATRAADGDSG